MNRISTAHGATILLNGQPRELGAGMSIAALLAELRLKGGHVAVEVNMELVPRACHSERMLAEGDRVEVVTLVGGG